MSAARRSAWLLGYALTTFLSFPHPLGERVVDLGTPLAFAAPALLWVGIAGLRPRPAFGAAFLAGLAAHAAVLHWIYVVTVTYGHAWPPIGAVAVLGLAAWIALVTGLVGGASAWLAARGAAGPFALAALWVAVDHLRSFALTGFPWATLGYALHADRPLVALTPFAGVYVLSFAAALGGAALAALLLGRRRAGAAGLAALAALHGLGALAAASAPAEGGASLRVAVLQGNIDQGSKWSPAFAERTLQIYEELTRAAAAAGARVVVWPETAVPGSPDADSALRDRLEALARRVGAVLVVGAVGLDGYDGAGRAAARAVRYYDSAYLVDPRQGTTERYDKAHLVPFGEYVPLRDLLGRFVKAVATGVASADVSAGVAPRSAVIPAPGEAGDLRVGVPICYELLFPDLMRRFAADGARVLFAITNDAWYGRTGAPHQFLVMTALRAAESRRWIARAANTGVSALIDERGGVRAQTRIFERDFLVGEVGLASPEQKATFYVRHGDVFAGACWAASGGAALLAARRSRRGGATT